MPPLGEEKNRVTHKKKPLVLRSVAGEEATCCTERVKLNCTVSAELRPAIIELRAVPPIDRMSLRVVLEQLVSFGISDVNASDARTHMN